MTSFLTDEQAAYLSKLYTGTDAPKLHKAPTMYVCYLERRYAERGQTIHRLERRLSRANRKYRALHRAMHEDTKTASVALHASVERFAEALANAGDMLHRHYPHVVECSAYGAAWPRFEDGKPVEVGDTVKGVMVDVTVASIVFRADCVVLYDSQMFHYVKLDGGERAQRPDGTRLPLD